MTAVAYKRLGVVRMIGQSDAAYELNPYLLGTGWDVVVNAGNARRSELCISGQWPTLTTFECYQIALDGPVGSSVLMMINRQPYNFVLQGWNNYDDPTQPVLINTEDEIQFCWNTAFAAGPYTPSGGANVQPVVTLWLRAESGGEFG